MTKIVIVGAGFGGLACALNLEKTFGSNPDVSLTLVDRHDFSLFTSNLYEVATAEEEMASLDKLKKSITLPLREVLKGKKLQFIRGELKEIDQQNRTLTLQNRKLDYDFLVLALGSVSDYFGIAGAEEFALPLKTFRDTMRIKNQIEFAIQLHRQDAVKKTLRVVIAGGGYTGAEFAAELSQMVQIVAWKNQYPPEKIELEILEASNQLVGGFSERLSRDTYERLKSLNVKIRLLTPIVKIDKNFVETLAQERISYDVLVWTVGVRSAPIPFRLEVPTDRKGRIETSPHLQVKTHENIFIVGDACSVKDSTGAVSHGTAQDAIHEGRYVARVLPDFLKNIKPEPYMCLKHGFVVNLGGKWAIVDLGKVYFKGFLAFLVGQAAHMRYYISVVGVWKALKYTLFDIDLYGRND